MRLAYDQKMYYLSFTKGTLPLRGSTLISISQHLTCSPGFHLNLTKKLVLFSDESLILYFLQRPKGTAQKLLFFYIKWQYSMLYIDVLNLCLNSKHYLKFIFLKSVLLFIISCQFNVNGFGGNIFSVEMIYCHEVVFTINEVVAYVGIR